LAVHGWFFVFIFVYFCLFLFVFVCFCLFLLGVVLNVTQGSALGTNNRMRNSTAVHLDSRHRYGTSPSPYILALFKVFIISLSQ